MVSEYQLFVKRNMPKMKSLSLVAKAWKKSQGKKPHRKLVFRFDHNNVYREKISSNPMKNSSSIKKSNNSSPFLNLISLNGNNEILNQSKKISSSMRRSSSPRRRSSSPRRRTSQIRLPSYIKSFSI